MIKHIVSITGCVIMVFVSIFCYFFGINPPRDPRWILITISFIILIFLIYWNLKLELKET